MNEQASRLAVRIADAFPVCEPPPDHGIAVDGAPRRVTQALAGWTWNTLPDDRISSIRCELAMLRPKAFAYYLPAFLRYLLFDPNRGDVMIDDLLDLIAPPSIPSIENAATILVDLVPDAGEIAERLRDPSTHRAFVAAFEERVRPLNDEQVATIGAVVSHFKDAWSASMHPGGIERVLSWVRDRLNRELDKR